MTVAIITGASSGVGRDIAIVYAKQGINVVVAARREKELNELVDKLTADYGGKHLAVQTDLTDKNSIKNLFDRTVASYGAFDILVNNAGDAKLYPLHDYDDDEVDTSLALLNAAVRMHHQGIRHLRQFLDEKKIKKGYVVDVLSTAGIDFLDKNGIYAATKHAVAALSVCNQIDQEFDKENIVFIRLYPSNIATSFLNEKKVHPKLWKLISTAEKLDPMDVARIVGKLTEEGDSIDLLMKETDEGTYIGRFKRKEPHYTFAEELTLEEFLKKS